MQKHMEHNRRPAFRPGPFPLVHTFSFGDKGVEEGGNAMPALS
jgi:hypothetical protein